MNNDNDSILIIQELAQMASSLRDMNEIIQKMNARISELNQSMRRLEHCFGVLTLPFQSSVYEQNVHG
ncbi:hypothetical protein JH06_1786 [Blastocystis sp. subtype 4]|uniref:hypothetical protein n=1 Tax=Blastocystis sp. subtype 4 TaxID=944170 RepID=UPI0007115279|nr:hypothetical protein JH06_1786 [Blastocystis sp. subtype 4]KNB44216.1 hypothetical protein JH06_1786 [Blastocystis sp. subtype 4]|eukprot:XP_014527659.1 hypothetical protein JH06_1786 [Blastocystis sp. subtype 4]